MPIVRVLLRLTLRGPRPPRDGRGLIVAPNHQSWIDPILVQLAIYPRRVTFLMTEVYFDMPIVGLYFRAVGARPVREAGPSVDALRAAHEALEAGEALCLFPEGGITCDGKLQKGQRGVARLARRTGATVVPVGIRGAIHVYSRLQKTPRLHPVEVRLGEAMRYEGADGREGELLFTEELMKRVEELAYG